MLPIRELESDRRDPSSPICDASAMDRNRVKGCPQWCNDGKPVLLHPSDAQDVNRGERPETAADTEEGASTTGMPARETHSSPHTRRSSNSAVGSLLAGRGEWEDWEQRGGAVFSGTGDRRGSTPASAPSWAACQRLPRP